MYCELHCHTSFSFLDGASSPEALLERARVLGMPALAITDHNGLYGAVRFWTAARALGINPIIGAELSLVHGSHLTLLASSREGYANLSRLISLGQLAGSKGAPSLTIDDVARHQAGLLCLSGCREGAVAGAVLLEDRPRARRAAARLVDIFGRDRFWIELQRHWRPEDARLDAGLRAAAHWAGVQVVATNDVHYAESGGYRLHDILTATRHSCSLAELEEGGKPVSSVSGLRLPVTFGSGEFYLKGQVEMEHLFADLPEATRASGEIAERCDAGQRQAGSGPSLDFSNRRTPAFPARSLAFPHGIPSGDTAFSYLYALCHQGLRTYYNPATPRAVRQLGHELSVIEGAGLADYFLIVWDIVRHARAEGIRCQGRGSAANSLVAYLLGITPVDPLRYNLLFERFLSDQSDTMPDIDIDFAADRRDEVIAYIYRQYGAEHAAMVCNVVTYQWRSAVRDVARALGYAAQDLGRIVDHAEDEVKALIVSGDDAGSDDEATGLRQVATMAAQLIGTPRHLSVHVGGMLVTALPLVEVVPVEHATKPGTVVVQWNKDSVEDAGLIKIDLLCLRTLGMITEMCGLIEQRHGAAPDLDRLTHDDPAVYRLMAEGDTIGCFQVESRAQSQMLPRLKPTCFEDLVIQVSIVRPGPIQGGMVHPYLRRRQGLEPPTYLHPCLEPVLAETLGVIIFQEQVIRVAIALAGFAPGEADRLRRAMSRNRSAEAMAALRERFVAGAHANGITREVAEESYRQLEGFATYGFCKSHAAAFALIAYQTLWLKAHFPAEFYCALLNHQPMGFYSPEVVVNDARRHGLTILRPDVNLSEDGCTLEATPGQAVQGSDLRLGLRYLHGLGEGGRERLLHARGKQPFADLTTFCRRTRLPRALVGDLVRAGALDNLHRAAPKTGRRQMLWTLGALQYEEDALVEVPDTVVTLPDLTDAEAMTWDYELLGLSPDDHPLRLLRPQLSAAGVLSAGELAAQRPGRIVRTAGIVVVRQAPPTAKGHLFITLEDETGLSNLILRPDLYAELREELHGAVALMAEGVMQKEGAASSVLVQRARRLKVPLAAEPPPRDDTGGSR